MSYARFPARKPDGSFCVDVGVRTTDDLQAVGTPRIQAWINDVWMPHNMTWIREWQTGANLATSRKQILNYSDEFMVPPEIALGPGTELRLRLKGNATAKFWKDWLISRIVPDLKAEFPGIGDLLYIRDCDE